MTSFNKFLIVCGGSGVGLLRQRRILGFDGEIQIDVREEIDKHRKNISGVDERYAFVNLDIPIGTAPVLLNYTLEKISKTNSAKADIRHIRFLADNYLQDVALIDGLAQSPAIGGLTINHEGNVDEIDSALNKMITEWANNIGTETPLIVYIVSSTAGGTGEGVHRFVAERLVKLLSTKPSPIVKLIFIRVGCGTYKAVNQGRQVALNTFFAIAADSAYKIRLQKKYPKVAVNTSWFYLDLPDVGTGEPAKPRRANMVAIASKVATMEELSKSLNLLLANDSAVLVRTGFWGRRFDENRLYAHTLKSLTTKIEELINPEIYIKKYLEQTRPTFKAGNALETILALAGDKAEVYKKLESGWRFPSYREPATLENSGDIISSWVSKISSLLGRNLLNLEPEPQYLVDEIITEDGEQKTKLVPLSVTVETSGEADWFRYVEGAQRAQAWSIKILGGRVSNRWTNGLLSDLFTDAKKINDIFNGLGQFGSTDRKAESLANVLPAFIEKTVQANILLKSLGDAERLLSRELKKPQKVLDYATQQFTIFGKHTSGKSPIIAAGLSDPLDQLQGRSWLALLVEVVERTNVNPQAFREEVLLGATGLTFSGLSSIVLPAGKSASIDEIKQALIANMGQIADKDGKLTEAIWWNGNAPTGIKSSYNYRILPKLDEDTKRQLGNGDAGVTFIYSELGRIGLNVLAFQGVSIARPGDTTATPKYLLEGFVPLVRETLGRWDHQTGQRSGKYEIAISGVVGDPLYKDLLLQVGFNQTEMNKLSEFYLMYSPRDKESLQSETKRSQAAKPTRVKTKGITKKTKTRKVKG